MKGMHAIDEVFIAHDSLDATQSLVDRLLGWVDRRYSDPRLLWLARKSVRHFRERRTLPRHSQLGLWMQLVRAG
uniref:Uncharacterized protein n=1 Tax=uncultured bacterium A1Q1_fos_1815 TaxID=1256553 RepID=L7VWH6_9BACT|nr:hypothetical protein [uncultured bacterium A1Q1_fos_1815]